MKRFLYGILVLAILLVGVTFTTKNAQVVELNYYFGVHWVTPLSFMLLTTLTVGIALGVLVSLAMQARMQRQLLQVRRENRQLEQEVNNLRALPIRDVP
ncbi:MAG TPA: LapA family protein [Acidiferrobacterales bacterium]|nr:LapA family protein [Acidiferrobacterales bacterium]